MRTWSHGHRNDLNFPKSLKTVIFKSMLTFARGYIYIYPTLIPFCSYLPSFFDVHSSDTNGNRIGSWRPQVDGLVYTFFSAHGHFERFVKIWILLSIPSGKHLQNYGHSPFSLNKSTTNGHVQVSHIVMLHKIIKRIIDNCIHIQWIAAIFRK